MGRRQKTLILNISYIFTCRFKVNKSIPLSHVCFKYSRVVNSTVEFETPNPKRTKPQRKSGRPNLRQERLSKGIQQGTSLVVQGFGLCTSTAGGMGSIPGQRTETPTSCVAWPKKDSEDQNSKGKYRLNCIKL